ncbi:MAG TPA: CHAT domain-containing protein [Bryobacteraceae bacterium]|nr:CHAT domain-containing protein [Bryobacteraceae bacterium]
MAIVVCILIALCLIYAGDRSPTDWDAIYATAHSCYAKADFQASSRLAQRGYEYWQTRADSKWHWEFRLLLFESLLELEHYNGADQLLGATACTPELEKRRLADLGILQYRRREFGLAARTLAAAEAVSITPPAPELDAKILLTLGMSYLKQEQYPEAEREFLRAVEALPSRSLMRFYALNDLGLVYQKQFRWDEALPWFERAEQEARAFGARRAEMLAVGNQGNTYVMMGDFTRALPFYKKALAIAEEIRDPSDQQAWLAGIGTIYEELGQLNAASQHYHRALSLLSPDSDEELRAKTLENLANVALAAGDLKTAARWIEAESAVARKVNTKTVLAAAEFNSARLAMALLRYGEAEARYRHAAALNNEAHRPMEEWECHSGLASLYRASSRPAEADAEYRAAIQIIERERSKIGGVEHRITFLSSLIRFYQDYVDFLMDRGEQTRAFDIAASARARVLAERIGRPEIAEARVIQRLQRAALTARTVLMAYWLAPRRSFLWVIDSSGLRAFTLPAQDAIAANVARWRNAILDGQDPRESEPNAGKWLFENLIARHYRPPSGSRVVIAPDGPLYSLNFETLAASPQGEYWIRDADIAVAPSLALLRPELEPALGRLLLIADPDFTSPEFPRLTNAKREVELVSKHFPARDVYEASHATARAYLDAPVNSYSTIHFAAHALASRDNPLDSAIILSGPQHDHKLYARDIMTRRLSADLVTLSACQTAGAKTYSGEGLTGLAWAFLSAGARNVVAGLWDVNDHATAEIMSRFYDSISRGRTPSESLREAKIALIDSPGPMRKPVYWAAFETFTRALYVNEPTRGLAENTILGRPRSSR